MNDDTMWEGALQVTLCGGVGGHTERNQQRQGKTRTHCAPQRAGPQDWRRLDTIAHYLVLTAKKPRR
jgi:hypothetical protein